MARKAVKTTITIKDVALRAAVSIGTVSRVINGHEDVDAKLRGRVLKAVKDLKYRPNPRAQSFVRGSSRLIAFVAPAGHGLDAFTAALLCGAEEHCSQSGYAVVFTRASAAAPDYADAVIWLDSAAGPEGVRLGPGAGAANHVWFDDQAAMNQAVAYLHQLGHRHIWYLAELRNEAHEGRRLAFETALRANDLPPMVHSLAVAEDAFANGHAAVSQILEQKLPLTAVIADSDELALGAREALRQFGRDVPRDASIISFSHQPANSRLSAFTSLHLDAEEAGRQLARMAIQCKQSGAPQAPVIVPAQLVKRSSCRPLRVEARMVL